MMYTVTLPEAAWNQILNILGERQFREVNGLINMILQQTSKQAQNQQQQENIPAVSSSSTVRSAANGKDTAAS